MGKKAAKSTICASALKSLNEALAELEERRSAPTDEDLVRKCNSVFTALAVFKARCSKFENKLDEALMDLQMDADRLTSTVEAELGLKPAQIDMRPEPEPDSD